MSRAVDLRLHRLRRWRWRRRRSLRQQLLRAARAHSSRMYTALAAVVELHRRLRRLSVVLDGGLRRPRRLCRRAAAERRRLDALAWLGATVVVTAHSPPALGFALLRMKGHYFAIGSIAIVEVLRLLAIVVGGRDRRRRRPERADPARRARLRRPRVPLLDAGDDDRWRSSPRCWSTASRLGFGLRCIRAERGRGRHGGRRRHLATRRPASRCRRCSAARSARSTPRGWPTSTRPTPSRSC